MRHDTWQNFTTGLGTQRDKTTRGHFWPDLLLQHNELLALFNGSALARKVCEKRPTEIMRKGYDITIDGMKPDDVEDLLKAGTALKVDQRCIISLQISDSVGSATGFHPFMEPPDRRCQQEIGECQNQKFRVQPVDPMLKLSDLTTSV